MNFRSVNEILDFAIGKELASAAFYNGLASKMDRPWMKQAFEDFAREEMGHKAKLIQIREGQALEPAREKILDLKIADYTVAGEPSADMNYGDALVLAMKMEKAAFRLYSDMANSAADPALRQALQALAQEEAKHKLRFELEYDQFVQPEN
jgi:rubrerythrin